MKIFLQKVYLEGEEHIYECSIDDKDIIHFKHGKSSGISSNVDNDIMGEKIEEFEIDFPTLRENIKQPNFKISNINEKFLKESYDILEKMWVDE